MTDSNEEFLRVAITAARAGGEVLQRWASKFTVREKSPANLVTEADFESQQTIRKIILDAFPRHGFLGEEAGEDIPGEDGYRWIVDPLDGTSNYVHGFPYYAVSIGLEKDGELITGVILDPTRDELFSATKDGGAHLNGEPIRPSPIDKLSESLVMVSLPTNVPKGHFTIAQFLAALDAAQHVQRSGSAALNLCYVACGRMEAYFSMSLNAWDVAAGALIVQEAGGRISKIDGEPLQVDVPDMLSANGPGVHRELVRILESVKSGE